MDEWVWLPQLDLATVDDSMVEGNDPKRKGKRKQEEVHSEDVRPLLQRFGPHMSPRSRAILPAAWGWLIRSLRSPARAPSCVSRYFRRRVTQSLTPVPCVNTKSSQR